MDQPYLYLLLPYLACKSRCTVRGIEFRSAGDLADVPPNAAADLQMLCDMFYLQHDAQLKNFACAAVCVPPEADKRQRQLRHVYEAHLLIAYLNSAPHRFGGVFLPYECSSLYQFTRGDSHGSGSIPGSLVWQGDHVPDRVQLTRSAGQSSEDWVSGFVGIRNATEMFWVAEGSRIFPPAAHVTLNVSQDLAPMLEMFLAQPWNWGLRQLYHSATDMTDLREVQDRIFVGLEWYLRSCRTANTPAEAIVAIAIALESLLKVRAGEGLTERFKDAVMTLVGPVARLDSWLEQFYAARSKAVHEGEPHQLAFFAVDRESLKKKRSDQDLPHRGLIEFARSIFRICVATMASSASYVAKTGLPGQFIPNQERLVAICKTLKDETVEPQKRLEAIERSVFELREFSIAVQEPHIELSQIFGAATCLLKTYRTMHTSAELAELIDGALQPDGSEQDRFKRLEKCASRAREEYAKSHAGDSRSLTVFLNFLDYATSPGFALKALSTATIARKLGTSEVS